MSEIVFGQRYPWGPHVTRESGDLRLGVAIYAANADRVGEFSWPMREDHLEVMRADRLRTMLLWSVLCERCHHWCEDDLTRTPDPRRVTEALDHALLDSEDDLLAWLGGTRWSRDGFLRGCAQEGLADEGRALVDQVQQGPTDLDLALVAYCGGENRARKKIRRTPEAVPEELLPELFQVIRSVEWRLQRGMPTSRKEWDSGLQGAFRSMWPGFASEARQAVGRLLEAESPYPICEGSVHGRQLTRHGYCKRCLGAVSD